MGDMCPTTCHHIKLCPCMADMCLTTCHNQGACTYMVDMCPPHGTSRGHGHAWVPCVPTHFTPRDYGYAWVPFILKNGTSIKSGRACPSPCDDHQWNSHNSFISCPFWTFLGSLESLSRAQPGSDTNTWIWGSKSSPSLCPKQWLQRKVLNQNIQQSWSTKNRWSHHLF